MNQQKIIFIVGPTAVGKTDVALFLAKRLETEIISCDAMQVYKEISVITNKPSAQALKTVPHRLVGYVPISKDFDVAFYLKEAVREIQRMHRKGKMPVIVGGSGFYMSALLDGLFEGVGKDDKIRRRLETQARTKGSGYLYGRLQRADPAAAAKIHPNNVRRVIRALEVYLISRKPISRLQKNRRGLWGNYDIRIFCLNRERERLYRLIENRVEHMFQSGAVDEIKRLSGKKWGKTARGIIGVDEIRKFLNGEHNLEEAKRLIALKTRRYAKRQLTWFRKDTRLCWIILKEQEGPKTIAEQIYKEVMN